MLLVSLFTFVELNCENLFDCRHDSLKNDTEFLPDGYYRWTPKRYWDKLEKIGKTVISCGDMHNSATGTHDAAWQLPDMVALCEVENDSVMRDLTRRSLLRGSRYEYVVTSSPDERGIDVALMYSPFTFALINHRSVRVKPVEGMRPTRDVLYASGRIASGDTLHVVAVHLPSRRGGESRSRPFRMAAASVVCSVVDSIFALHPDANIIVAGDFNDYTSSESVSMVCARGLKDVSCGAVGSHGAKGTYRYQGEWGSLDHILVSGGIERRLVSCVVHDADFLITEDTKYGGVKPFRSFLGPRYIGGYSDHLPLVMRYACGNHVK